MSRIQHGWANKISSFCPEYEVRLRTLKLRTDALEQPVLHHMACQGFMDHLFPVYVYQPLSCVQLCGTPWTVTHQASLSMGFSRHPYWSRLPCPPPEDLPDPGIKLRSPTLQADSLPSEPQGKPERMSRKTKKKNNCII